MTLKPSYDHYRLVFPYAHTKCKKILNLSIALVTITILPHSYIASGVQTIIIPLCKILLIGTTVYTCMEQGNKQV